MIVGGCGRYPGFVRSCDVRQNRQCYRVRCYRNAVSASCANPYRCLLRANATNCSKSAAVLISPSTNDPTTCTVGKDAGCAASKAADSLCEKLCLAGDFAPARLRVTFSISCCTDPSCCAHFPDFEPEHYKLQHFANSVYEIELTTPVLNQFHL